MVWRCWIEFSDKGFAFLTTGSSWISEPCFGYALGLQSMLVEALVMILVLHITPLGRD